MEETIIQGNPEITEKQEKVALGLLGALLGGILGGAAIVLLGQMGMISAVSGVILAFCSLKGYELLAGKLSKKGIFICILVMLIVPYVADRISWALVIVRDLQWQFGDAFRYVHDVIKAYAMEADYWKDLLLIYAFAALGAFTTVKQAFKKK